MERPAVEREIPHGGNELAFILQMEREGPSAPLLERLLELRSGDGPQVLRDASDRLVRQDAPWALDLAPLAHKLIEAAGNRREQRLFLSCSLNPEPLSFEDLAAREGMPRRRANKLVRRSESRVRAALTTAPVPLPWLVSVLGSRLGAVAPVEQVADELDRLDAGAPTVAELVTWLAGPYLPLRQQPGWLASTPAPVVARTVAYINEDGGVRRLADLHAQLADVGISAGNFRPWLQANGAMPVEDLAVSVKGPLADVVERILDAYGKACTPEQIRADVAGGGRQVDAGAVTRALGDRRRFTLSVRGEASLVSWGQERGRAPKKAHGRPRTGQDESRTGAGPSERDGGTTEERFWLWVRVDVEVLRGSEAPVPVALVEGLGLAPFARRTFSSRWGRLPWPTMPRSRRGGLCGPWPWPREHVPTTRSCSASALGATWTSRSGGGQAMYHSSIKAPRRRQFSQKAFSGGAQ